MRCVLDPKETSHITNTNNANSMKLTVQQTVIFTKTIPCAFVLYIDKKDIVSYFYLNPPLLIRPHSSFTAETRSTAME